MRIIVSIKPVNQSGLPASVDCAPNVVERVVTDYQQLTAGRRKCFFDGLEESRIGFLETQPTGTEDLVALLQHFAGFGDREQAIIKIGCYRNCVALFFQTSDRVAHVVERLPGTALLEVVGCRDRFRGSNDGSDRIKNKMPAVNLPSQFKTLMNSGANTT